MDLPSIPSTTISFALAAGWLALLLGAGYLAIRLPVVRHALLPASLVAGLIGLVFGPAVAGAHFPDWQLPAALYAEWKHWPALLINVVFATLFLARPLIPLRRIWDLAGPQVVFGQTLAWGQYLVGALLVLLILTPLFGINPLAAALIEISFEGGHGTAAGLAPVFAEMGFPEGQDMAVGLATVGLIAALISGLFLVHWGRRRHHLQAVHQPAELELALHRRLLADLRRHGVFVRTQLTLRAGLSHAALVAAAIGIGWLILQALVLVEGATWARHGIIIFGYVPLFPLCMFGGMIAHAAWERLGLATSRPLVDAIAALSLSALIATAIGTLSLGYIVSNLGAFLLLAAAGIAWTVGAFLFLAPRIFPRHWFQRGIVDMGQSMGMTATGLLFLQMVDPKDETSAMESFGYKQLFFEPWVGGGIVTALSMPFIFAFGLPVFAVLAAVIFAGWLFTGLRVFGRRKALPDAAAAGPAAKPVTPR